MNSTPWEEGNNGKGIFIRDDDRLQTWSVDSRHPAAILELLGSLPDGARVNECLDRIIYIDAAGTFWMADAAPPHAAPSEHEGEERDARKIEELDERLRWDGPWDGKFIA